MRSRASYGYIALTLLSLMPDITSGAGHDGLADNTKPAEKISITATLPLKYHPTCSALRPSITRRVSPTRCRRGSGQVANRLREIILEKGAK
jgi:hypothetical protein